MSWRVVVRPEAGDDVITAAEWYYPEHFPSRVIYEVLEEEQTVVVAAVIHAVRHDRHWRNRL